MRVYLAGTASRKWILYENIPCRSKREKPDIIGDACKRERERETASPPVQFMKIYLAGVAPWRGGR